MPLPNPHDALVKAVFATPRNAELILRAALPPDVLRSVDLRTLRHEPASFVDEALGEAHEDLIFSVRARGRRAFVYALIEHKSWPEPLLPFASLRYIVRLWEDWLRKHPRARRLPAVIPIVLRQAPAASSDPRTLAEVIDLPRALTAPTT